VKQIPRAPVERPLPINAKGIRKLILKKAVKEPLKTARPERDEAALSVTREAEFGGLKLFESLVRALESMGLSKPNAIQERVVPEALTGESLLFAAPTGTGKTLAYLLPIVMRLRQDEELGDLEIRPGRPRALILVPTRELAEQVLRVAKTLCHHVKFSCSILTGGERDRIQKDSVARSLDLLIATPGRLARLLKQGFVYLSDVRYVAIDEADTLCDSLYGFTSELMTIVQPLRSRAQSGDPGVRAKKVQFLLATATLEARSRRAIGSIFPRIRTVELPSLHRPPTSLRANFVRVRPGEDKLEILEGQLNTDELAIVFCNTIPSARAVEHYLRERGFRTASVHGRIPGEARAENFERFLRFETGVLVATDLAARGLDTMRVGHVLLFDFPLNPIEYLHRVGRTARAGREGRVTCLITKRDEPLARRIEEAMASGQPLESLSSKVTKEEARVFFGKAKPPKRKAPSPSRGAAATSANVAGAKAEPKRAPRPKKPPKPETPEMVMLRNALLAKAQRERRVEVSESPRGE
jgi:superfamily II DNA/RNA helicase